MTGIFILDGQGRDRECDKKNHRSYRGRVEDLGEEEDMYTRVESGQSKGVRFRKRNNRWVLKSYRGQVASERHVLRVRKSQRPPYFLGKER